MDSPHITYATHAGITPETEIVALSAVYRLVLEANRKKKTIRSGNPGDATVRSKQGGEPCRATSRLTAKNHPSPINERRTQ
jgi:hypothetical protein